MRVDRNLETAYGGLPGSDSCAERQGGDRGCGQDAADPVGGRKEAVDDPTHTRCQ
jgi:hypothetical protein